METVYSGQEKDFWHVQSVMNVNIWTVSWYVEHVEGELHDVNYEEEEREE